MRVSAISCARLRIPLRRPFRTALRTVEAVDDLVLLIHSDDGRVGHGSAPATPQITSASHERILADWRQLAPVLIGAEIGQLAQIGDRLQSSSACSNARAGLEIALHDLAAQQRGLPLFALLAEAIRQPSSESSGERCLSTDLTISADTPEAMVSDCLSALGSGHQSLKIKLGRDPQADRARMLAIAAAVAGRASLRLDANQGWALEPAITLMEAVEREGIDCEWLEQPLPAQDLAGMAQLAGRLRTPLLADESVHGPADLPPLLAARAAKLVNIKLMKAGGLVPALQLWSDVRAAGLASVIGCMLESPIGVAAAAHLAWACGVSRVDLDAPALAQFDPVRGNVRFEGPQISIGESPGLGIGPLDGIDGLMLLAGEEWR